VQRKTECVIRKLLSGLYGGILIDVLRMTPEDLSHDNCRTLSFTNQYGVDTITLFKINENI